MSNMLRTLRREAGTWKRREGSAVRSKLDRLRAERRKHQRQRRAVQVGLPFEPKTSLAAVVATILDRLRSAFAPRASSKGR